MATDLLGRAVSPEYHVAGVLLRAFMLCCVAPQRMEREAESIVTSLNAGDVLALARTEAGWKHSVLQYSDIDPSDHFEMRTFHLGAYAGQLDIKAVKLMFRLALDSDLVAQRRAKLVGLGRDKQSEARSDAHRHD